MIDNFNVSIVKLLVLSSLSTTSLFSQTNHQMPNHFSVLTSRFSRLLHPIINYNPLASVLFHSCLFTYLQTTAIENIDDFYQKRILFQFDGRKFTQAKLKIEQCIFKYCFSHSGSGCFNLQNSQCSIIYNKFLSNRGKYGGCFHCIEMRKISVEKNLFDKNKAEYFGAGFIDSYNTQINITQNNFTRNYGSKWVGALELCSSKSTPVTHSNLIFGQNSAKQCAAFFDLSTPPNCQNIENALFINNTAERRGGAITDFSYRMRANYSNCFFIGNNCKEGDCIYIETKKSLIMLFNCFFDREKEKAIFLNWFNFYGSNSKVICADDVIFESENIPIIKKKELTIRNNIPPVKNLDWFLPKKPKKL